MSDFGDFFSAVDGLGEDLVDAGVVVGTATATTIAWNLGVSAGLSQLRKVWPTMPTWVDNWVIPGVAVVGGVALGTMLSRTMPRVGRGLAYGLTYAGVRQMARQAFAGSFIATGLGDVGDGYMMDPNAALLGDGNLYDKYLGAAPLTIESNGGVSSLSASPVTVETVNPMFGEAPITIESGPSMAGFFQ